MAHQAASPQEARILVPYMYVRGVNLPNTAHVSLGDLPREDISILEEGEIDDLGSEEAPSASVFRNIWDLPRRLFKSNPISANTRDRRDNQGNHSVTDAHVNRTRNKAIRAQKPNKSEFLVKNTKQVTVEDEGGVGIPFSALKELYKYKAFITNLSPDSNVDTIKSHINTKLGVNTLLKTVSPEGAPYLSLILICTSDSDSLDLRKAGLWPRGTVIKQCIPFNHKKKYANKNNQGTAPGGRMQRNNHQVHNQQGHNNQQRHGHSSRFVSQRNQDDSNRTIQRNREQQNIHDQWIDT